MLTDIQVTPIKNIFQVDWNKCKKSTFDVFARSMVNGGIFVPMLAVVGRCDQTMRRQALHLLIGPNNPANPAAPDSPDFT